MKQKGHGDAVPSKKETLEVEAQRKLEVALAVSGTAAALRKYFSESCEVARVQAWVVPVRMIPDVESLGAEL